MPIQWFPGHMATARREIRAAMREVDLVIEVLDARLPHSSTNPLVAGLRGPRPTLRILNKADLADPAVTAEWLVSLQAPGARVVTHQSGQRGFPQAVSGLLRELLPARARRPVLAMILGVPNVGKSSLINELAGRVVAKASNKPAVTRQQQRVQVGPELVLLDTPGFLWPRLSPEACAYRLAVTGAIADSVVDLQTLGVFAGTFLHRHYPGALAGFYGLEGALGEGEALLEAIGRRRGFLLKGGVVDLQRAAERLIFDLRAGNLGAVSLETPRDVRLSGPSAS